MSKKRHPERLDFFMWTVEDVGLWLEEINLGAYEHMFKENGINGLYLDSLSTFTTEQILRFIRRCHMKWGDFITLCKELRCIKVALLRGEEHVVGPVLSISCIRQGGKAQSTIPCCLAEARTMICRIPGLGQFLWNSV